MEYVVWGGAALSMLGLVGIIYSIVAVSRAKKAGLSDDELRTRIGYILPLNLGALFVSMIGLMAVIIGIMLGYAPSRITSCARSARTGTAAPYLRAISGLDALPASALAATPAKIEASLKNANTR